MPTLRDQVRRALARSEPTPAEADRELAAIVRRARGANRTRARVVLALAPIAITALIFLVLHGRRPPEPPPPKVAAGGIHLYLHVDGEPLEKAVTLDLTQNGEH